MRYLSYKENRQHGTFSFPIAYYRLSPENPRYKMILHWHFENEIIKVESGTIDIFVEGKKYELKSGDVLFVPGEAVHKGIPHDCVYECVVFDLKLLLKNNNACVSTIQEFIRHEKQIDLMISSKDDDINEIINNLFCSMYKMNPGYEFKVQGSLYMLLGEIIEKKMYSENKKLKNCTEHRLQQFKNVLMFIEKNYFKRITLTQLANIAGMDKKYFCSFFREITGRPPIDYLNAYRIECACEQFCTTSFSIIDIAYNCGFHDASYFSKIFKKYKGINPREFQRRKCNLV
ncbi:MAG: AraC family transcriptional regulator [Sphaerochaetaceae bacterium]